jgi:hypothetical protein
MNDKRDGLKESLYKIWNGKVLKCLEPNEICTKRAIRAHSIQNGAILDMIQSDGHVIMPKLKFELNFEPKMIFESVGRNKATTFTGLCAEHDASIFAPIETAPINIENDLHLFLLAYRAVLKETHANIEGAIKNQLGYQEKVNLGLIPGDIPTTDGKRALGFLINSLDTYLYKREFDQMYSSRDFKGIQHQTIFLNHNAPTIAANSLFTSADNIQNPVETERIIFNIFPMKEGSQVIFSYLDRHEPFVYEHLREVLNANGYYRLYLMSKFILRNCENFVIAPKYFETISTESRDAMLDYFQRTYYKDLMDFEDKRIYLF